MGNIDFNDLWIGRTVKLHIQMWYLKKKLPEPNKKKKRKKEFFEIKIDISARVIFNIYRRLF